MMASSVISNSFIILDPVAHWLSLRGNQETLCLVLVAVNAPFTGLQVAQEVIV